MTSPRQIELLAPAKNADIAIEAIRHGADAVYIGPPANGARAAAANSLQEIERAVDFAHLFNARVYATVNTIIYESELKAVEKMIRSLYNIGVDALIVQDLGVLRMDIPPIALHASTQCDTRTPAKAKFLEAAGFSQIVPARELSLEETATICNAVSVPVEVFVHGALCVSYSGDCYASYATTGRSANRGECAQLCRLPYTLSDRHGNILIADKHILSLKDLNRSAMLADLLKAGVSSFKIEGRLKDADYVKNVVAAYRRALDAIISANPDEYTRSSSGTSICSFTPALEKSFNRGFTTYFSNGPAAGMASFNSPKWVGEKIATVKRATPSFIDLDTRAAIANGDGLGYFDPRGKFCGFRVNRAEASRIFPAKPVSIKPGTEVYRNSDKAWADTLAGQTATRTIDISMTLRATADAIVLDITDEDSNSLTLSATCPLENAKAPQADRHRDILSKTGDTIYRVKTIDNRIADKFIPASILTRLRRDALAALDSRRRAAHRFIYRTDTHPDLSAALLSDTFSYHENIANSLARSLYTDAGAKKTEPALECSSKEVADGTTVMTTRYCIRRECNRCLRTPEGAKWTGPLFIKSGNYSFKLDFDCNNCRMSLKYCKTQV
jgi:putative protease